MAPGMRSVSEWWAVKWVTMLERNVPIIPKRWRHLLGVGATSKTEQGEVAGQNSAGEKWERLAGFQKRELFILH